MPAVPPPHPQDQSPPPRRPGPAPRGPSPAAPPRLCLTIFSPPLCAALEPQPARPLPLLEPPWAGGRGRGGAGKGPLPAGRTQLLRALPRPPQPLGAGLAVLFLLLRAAIPQDTIALRAALRALEPVIDHIGALPPPRVGLAMHLAPAQRVAEQVVAEPSVFRPGAGHDGQKAPVLIGNQAHVLARA